MESENNGQLNFLDLVIKRKEAAHSFGIFRKETATDILIPAIPITTLNVKWLGFLVDRLLSIPMNSTQFDKELHSLNRNLMQMATRCIQWRIWGCVDFRKKNVERSR